MGVADIVKLPRSVDRLRDLENKHGKAIDKLTAQFDALSDRATRLESREEIVVSEARAAASHAATQVAIASVADISRRVGVLEERTSRRRLPPS